MSQPLDPERWAKVDALFDQASRRPASERAAFLAEACRGDEGLRREVESLLAASDADMSRRMGAVERAADRIMADMEPPAVGQRFGAWRAVEEIGRGGMGVVYKAVRDGDDFQQTVAVKVLPGALFSPKTMERFRNERRILAGLDHPNIARLLDGGTTPAGVPYVVIEYVDGVPVDSYCASLQLDLEARIWLFLALCDAVHYAHRNLVVHRDLKPSNILVTREGVPKLLDFGIAKLLDPPDESGQAETLGMTQSRVMTPRFASPEQLAGKRVATPSDVYSLGVVLYRLLTGRHPYGEAPSGGSVVGQAEVMRRMLESDPEPPSLAAGDARLRGDLDTIVLKAMRRDVSERYDSVRALADDLRSYLTRRPIGVLAGSWRYRLTKFVRRHTAAVLAATVAAVLLLGEAGLFLRRLARERDVARTEAVRAAAALDFLTDVFRATAPDGADARALTAREVLVRGGAAVDERLGAQPELRAEILSTLGVAWANLGGVDSARSALERSLALRDSLYAPGALERARGLADLGELLVREGRLERADSLLRAALSIRSGKLSDDDPDVVRLRAALADIQRRLDGAFAGDGGGADPGGR